MFNPKFHSMDRLKRKLQETPCFIIFIGTTIVIQRFFTGIFRGSPPAGLASSPGHARPWTRNIGWTSSGNSVTWRRDALGLNMPFGNAVEFHPQEVGQLYTLYTYIYIYYLSCFQHIYKTHILIYTYIYIYTHVFMYILLLYIPLYGLSLAYPHAWMGKN